MNLKDLKLDLKRKSSKAPEQFYPIKILKEQGFTRSKCTNCGTFYWSTVTRKNCGEPECNNGYSFINNSPTKSKIGYLETWKKFSSTMSKLGYTPIKTLIINSFIYFSLITYLLYRFSYFKVFGTDKIFKQLKLK